MKVIIIHGIKGDSVAIVADDTVLTGVFYTEVDESDSKGLLKDKPRLQAELRIIFKDVMSMFGLAAFTPGEPNAA